MNTLVISYNEFIALLPIDCEESGNDFMQNISEAGEMYLRFNRQTKEQTIGEMKKLLDDYRLQKEIPDSDLTTIKATSEDVENIQLFIAIYVLKKLGDENAVIGMSHKTPSEMGRGIEKKIYNVCKVCDAPAKNKCAGCEKVRYCCRDHQKADWKSHKAVCCK